MLRMLPNVFTILRKAMLAGGCVAWEWPQRCDYWEYPQILDMIQTFKLSKVFTKGCAFGLASVIPKTLGAPMSKTWAIATNCEPMHCLMKRECTCRRDHAACRGRDASHSETYTAKFVDCIHKSFKEFV